MIAALVAGLLAGYGIAMPVGAVATYLVALTARTSLKTGAYAALGVATADGLYALIATLGGSVIAPLIEPITTPLKWISALVLIALAVRGAITAINQHRRLQTSARTADTPPIPARAYFGLLGMTMLNPTTVIYFTALVLGGRTTPTPLHQTVFVTAAFIASSSWQLLLAAGGALLGRALTSRGGRLTTALASSLLICALAVHLLLTPPLTVNAHPRMPLPTLWWSTPTSSLWSDRRSARTSYGMLPRVHLRESPVAGVARVDPEVAVVPAGYEWGAGRPATRSAHDVASPTRFRPGFGCDVSPCG